MKLHYHIIAAILLLLFTANLNAQELDKVVFVESSFKPLVEQAEKMSELPLLSDTLQMNTEIQYSVLPSRLDSKYRIKPIKPAKLVGSSLDKLYNSKLRLGFGNYTTPLAEFSIQNLRSKEYAIGAYVYHRSSHNKIKLNNGHKVPAGYGINKVSVYGKRFYNDFNVEAELGFNAKKGRLYGYNTSNFSDSLPQMENNDIRQWYSQIMGRVEAYSTTPDSNSVKYRIGLAADYFSDDYANSQNHLDIPGQLAFNIKTFRLELNGNLHYFRSVLDTVRGVNDYVFQVRPVLTKSGDSWNVRAGLNTYFTSYEDKVNVFPEAEIQFGVIEETLKAYFGVNGFLEVNHFSKIANENYYITPGVYVENTKHKFIGYGGVKGLLSSQLGYTLDMRFSSVENLYLFQNDTITELENTFVPVYDDADIIKLSGELWYSPLTFLDFYLRAVYNEYTLAREAKAWHKPTTELTFSTQYNYKEKIYAKLDIIHLGGRYAKNFSNLNEPIELDNIWDVNLGLEYKYNNVLSAFLDIHNLLAKQYQIWNQYPAQRFNMMIGFSYKF